MNYVAEQNVEIMEEMEIMKNDFKGAFIQLAEGLDMCIRNLIDDNKKKFNSLDGKISQLYKKINNFEDKTNTSLQNITEKISTSPTVTVAPAPSSSAKNSSTSPGTPSRSKPEPKGPATTKQPIKSGQPIKSAQPIKSVFN